MKNLWSPRQRSSTKSCERCKFHLPEPSEFDTNDESSGKIALTPKQCAIVCCQLENLFKPYRVVASNKSLENERHNLKSKVHDLSQSLNSSRKQLAELEDRLKSLRDMEMQNDEEIMNLIRDEPGLIHEVKTMFCNCDQLLNYTCVYCKFEA